MRKHLWIGFLFAAVCLYYAFRGISFRALGAAISHADPLPILLALGLYFIEFFIRSGRWSILIRPIKHIRSKELYWPLMIGFFANNVLPFRMGEFVRAHVCGTKFNISRTASLGSIFLERIFDTLSFLTTFLVASLFYPFPHYMDKGAWLLGGVCVFAIILLLMIRVHEKGFNSLLERSPVPSLWKSKINHLVTQFNQSTAGIHEPRYIIEAMALSLTIWIMEGTFIYLVARSFAVNLQYPGAFFLLFALGLSVTLPQAPGYVGTFELFGVTAFGLLGIPKNLGLPVILAVHGLQFTFVGLMGILGLWKEGLSFHSMTSTQQP